MRRRTKGQPIGRRVGLKLGQFLGEFGREQIGDGGEHLRHLHQRTLEPAQGRGKLGRLLLVVLAAEQVAAPIFAATPPTLLPMLA